MPILKHDLTNHEWNECAKALAEYETLGHTDVQTQKLLSERFQITVTRTKMAQLRKRSVYLVCKDEWMEAAKKEGKHRITGYLKEWLPLVDAAMKKKLEEGSIEAVKQVLKVAGFEDKAEGHVGDTTLNVIMPGAKSEQTIELPKEVKDTSDE